MAKKTEAEKAKAEQAKADKAEKAAKAKEAKAAKAKADKEAAAKKGKTFKVSLVKAKDYSYGHRKFFQGRPVICDEKLASALKASGFFRVDEVNPKEKAEEGSEG